MRLSVLAVITFLAIGGCRDRDDVPPAFAREVRRAQRATMQAGTHPTTGTVEKGSMSIAQSWSAPIRGEWEPYLKETFVRLAPDYRCPEPAPREVTCSRSLPGDYLQLTLTPLREAEGLSVRVRLEARPD